MVVAFYLSQDWNSLLEMEVSSILAQKSVASTQEGLALYDQLEVIDADFMLGRWKGTEFPSNHPMDGLLEISGWYGKAFLDTENVHPLLFYTSDKKGLYAVNPTLVFPFAKMNLPSFIIPYLKALAKPFVLTKRSKARLRMIEYRGKVSATMQYDHLPINDVFRKIDENTVLGAMDMKGEKQPYFFLLERENTTYNGQY